MSEPWRGCAEEAEALHVVHCWCDPPTPNVYASACVDCLQRALERAYVEGVRAASDAAAEHLRNGGHATLVPKRLDQLADKVERGEAE